MVGSLLRDSFRTESVGARGEIALFRAFIRAFNALGPNAVAEEYHGNRYQVTFSAARGAGRTVPRCELCDVMIIHYPAGNPNAARVTFNQAKVTTNELICGSRASVPYNFRANLEQWDLLSNRPSISAATATTHLPYDLLSSALLPSVGTFGVFYPQGSGFDFAYFVADGLWPLKNSENRTGTLQWGTPLQVVRKIGHYKEATATCCMYTFGEALSMGLIGTPLHQALYGSSGTPALRNWLASVLVSLREKHADSELPNELLEGLELMRDVEEPSRGGEPSTPRAVVLIRT
ncbi:hypothetical protein PMI34_05219 [Pseudomonas sp. GM74]|nr:hypothetical protein PMI34_05219 [Pseudomonas sp. GM74]